MITIDLPIVTRRLRIRRFEERDREAFLAFMLDPDCTRYLVFPDEMKTREGASGLLDAVMASYDSGERVHSYVIARAKDDLYVGSCGLAPYPEGGCEVYYALNPEHQGRGYAAEAMAAFLAELPADLTVRAFCHPENHAAHAVARRLGMVCMGEQEHAGFGTTGILFVRPEIGGD
jgi:RimJ/RimL family protein N-acetyltransferase